MKKILFFGLLVFLLNTANSTTYTAIADGDFESAATWSPSGPPVAGDIFIIPSGVTVTVTTNYAPLLNSGTVSGTLVIQNGSKLNFVSNGILQILFGGLISGGNGGSTVSFSVGNTYSGPFNQPGIYYYNGTSSGPGNPLPLKFVSFKARLENKAVKLSWETESESAMSELEVQWSSTGTSDWSTLNIQNARNTGGTEKYEYTYVNITASLNYFRIKGNEKSGKIVYSPVMFVKAGQTSMSLFPTIAYNTVTCKLSSISTATVTVSDASGRIAKRLQIKDLASFTIDVSGFSKGIYYVTINQDGYLQKSSFVKD